MNGKRVLILIFIGVLNFVLFAGIFRLMQIDNFYKNTLGTISQNYERVGTWDNYEIQKKSIPFVKLSDENLETWDAAIYKCISERMYLTEDKCFGNVRAAFFPLLPILWNVTQSSPIGISIINYFLFSVSIAILILLLFKDTWSNKKIIYAILISLPSTIIFYIPYTESLFMFTATISVIGILKKKYGLMFAGFFLLSLVRPATIFVLFALILVEIFIFARKKDLFAFVKETALKSLPFVLGYFCAILIQRVYSGSWTAMVDAQQNWNGGFQSSFKISDWSVEGFGLSVFSLFFVCIPLLFWAFYLISSRKKKTTADFLSRVEQYGNEYLLLVSSLYLLGIFVFTLLTSGGNLHSFFRFTLASPMFYIVLIGVLNGLSTKSIKQVLTIFLCCCGLLFFFLLTVEYGGMRTDFSFFGMYLFLAVSFFLITKRFLPKPAIVIIVVSLVVSCTIWNTYLLNAFLSNAWVFT